MKQKEYQFPTIQNMTSNNFLYDSSGFGIKRNNSEYRNYFNYTIIGLVKDPDIFMKLLKTKKGVNFLVLSNHRNLFP